MSNEEAERLETINRIYYLLSDAECPSFFLNNKSMLLLAQYLYANGCRLPEIKNKHDRQAEYAYWEKVPGTCGAHRCSKCKNPALYEFASSWSPDVNECLSSCCPHCGMPMHKRMKDDG